MKTNRGFTLIEVLIASAILVCGLVAVAAVFSFAIRTNASNKQMALATALVYEKMEEFRSASFTAAIWTATPASEDFVISGNRFIRTWDIDDRVPRTVTVTVFAEINPLTHKSAELIRVTTLVSPTF